MLDYVTIDAFTEYHNFILSSARWVLMAVSTFLKYRKQFFFNDVECHFFFLVTKWNTGQSLELNTHRNAQTQTDTHTLGYMNIHVQTHLIR